MEENQITIRYATEEFFGNAGGKVVGFETTERKWGIFGGFRLQLGSILIQIGTVKPEGAKDSWTFDGQILSSRGPFARGTRITGFYAGPNCRNDLGFGKEPKTGWMRAAA